MQKINYQSSSRSGRGNNANRYALQFYKESDERIQEMKKAALAPLQFVDKINLEIGTHDFAGYNFPKRPEWSYAMSKEQLDRNENSFFTVHRYFETKPPSGRLIDCIRCLTEIHFGRGKMAPR